MGCFVTTTKGRTRAQHTTTRSLSRAHTHTLPRPGSHPRWVTDRKNVQPESGETVAGSRAVSTRALHRDDTQFAGLVVPHNGTAILLGPRTHPTLRGMTTISIRAIIT